MKKELFRIVSFVGFLLITGIIFLLVLSFVPFFGWSSLVIRSGSMEPAIPVGSLVFIKEVREYTTGDIVTRENIDEELITHRIIAKGVIEGTEKFRTKGDANENYDARNFTQDTIVGKVVVTIPLIGYVVSYAQTTYGFLFLIIIPSVIIIYEELKTAWKEFILWKRQKRKK